jgi:integrase
MAKDLLSDRQCAAARGREDGRVFYLNDGDGLRLQVRPDGSKYWLLRYKITKGDGTKAESTHGLGRYPETKLAEARVAADAARKVVAAGKHPTTERRIRRASEAQSREATFTAVADEWLGRMKPDWSETHHERNEGLLQRVLYPDLGALPIDGITEEALLRTLRKTYDAGRKESARRARAIAASVFQFAKDTHRAKANPARELADSTALEKPPVRHFAALKAKDVGPMLRALTASQAGPVLRAAILLMLYTGMRDTALRKAKWSEIDLEAATWTVPGHRMKSGREHRLPLPKQAIEVLTILKPVTRADGNSYVFASHGKHGHLAENTIRLQLHAWGFEVTAHGFRSLLTDVLNERGFNPDAIERQLDHVPEGVRKAYLRSDFFELRREMSQWFADWADAQRKEEEGPAMPANVVPLKRTA